MGYKPIQYLILFLFHITHGFNVRTETVFGQGVHTSPEMRINDIVLRIKDGVEKGTVSGIPGDQLHGERLTPWIEAQCAELLADIVSD